MVFRHLSGSPRCSSAPPAVLEPGHALHRLDEPRSPGDDTDYFPPCGGNVGLDHLACENIHLPRTPGRGEAPLNPLRLAVGQRKKPQRICGRVGASNLLSRSPLYTMYLIEGL